MQHQGRSPVFFVEKAADGGSEGRSPEIFALLNRKGRNGLREVRKGASFRSLRLLSVPCG